MIDRFEILASRLRRAFSPIRWSARFLGHRELREYSDDPGLVMIQIDGLSESTLRRAIREGRMPYVRRLIERDGHRIHSFYSGLPSSTPAVQGELFYGIPAAVPAWRYRDPILGRMLVMGDPSAAHAIEARLAAESEGLLTGGAAWSDMYCGGSAESHFCVPNVRFSELSRAMPPHRVAMLLVLHARSVLRVLESLVIMNATIFWDLVSHRYGLRRLRTELRTVPMRVAMSAVVREIIAAGASIQAERGVPIIHMNFLGYDEDAHLRGPQSRFARSALTAIDRSIARVVRAARRSRARDYQVWIYADHGQENAVPFEERQGRNVPAAVEEVYGRLVAEEAGRESIASNGLPAGAANASPPEAANGSLVVTHQGSVGVVYLPARHDRAFLEQLAEALVRDAGIPMVVIRGDDASSAVSFSASGRAELPQEADIPLGPQHPHRDAVATDLVKLAHHQAAGDLVIAGWNPVQPLSLQIERGTHGGPGPEETGAFALLPPEVLTDAPDMVLRPAQLRDLALETLGRKARRTATRIAGYIDTIQVRTISVRLMTYNVHRCRGMDGKYAPRRIARVIEQSRPDIICLQELDRHRSGSGGVDIARYLEKELHFHHVQEIDDGGMGNAVISDLPMRLVAAGALPAVTGRFHNVLRLSKRGALWVAVEVGGDELQVITTHLSLLDHERHLQVAALMGPDWLGHPECRGRVALAGDLNALPRSTALRLLRRRLKSVVEPKEETMSLHTWSGRVPIHRIDHVLVSETVKVRSVHVPRTSLTRVASDHLPLVVDLVMEVRAPNPEVPTPERELTREREHSPEDGVEAPRGFLSRAGGLDERIE